MTNLKPHILVTGGAGYIGSHVVLALREAGYDVVVIDDLSSGNKLVLPNDVPLVVGEISDQNLMRNTLKHYTVSSVMHFAGSIIVSESVDNPLKYYANNTESSRRLLECCYNYGIQNFVFSSTAAVYGNPTENPVHEETVLAPVNPYGASKMMFERILMDTAHISDIHFAILRYFNVSGADPLGRSGQLGENSTHLIRVSTEVALGKRAGMSVYGTDYKTPDGTCIRDFIHVSDLADAHILALEYLSSNCKSIILNCGYGRGYSVRQVLNTLEKLVGKKINAQDDVRRSGDVMELVSDPQKIRKILGWKPKYDNLDFIIKSALNWESRKEDMGLN